MYVLVDNKKIYMLDYNIYIKKLYIKIYYYYRTTKMDTLINPDVVPVILQHLDIPDLISYSKANKSCNEWAEEAWKLKLKNEVSLPVFRDYLKLVDEGKKWVTVYIDYKSKSVIEKLVDIVNSVKNYSRYYNIMKCNISFGETISCNWWLINKHIRFTFFLWTLRNERSLEYKMWKAYVESIS
jgi:hypothetical protein